MRSANRHILTLNAGSSSLKFALYQAKNLDCLAIGQIEGLGVEPHFLVKDAEGASLACDPLAGEAPVETHEQALAQIVDFLKTRFPGAEIAAVGHRIVHGGPDYAAPVILTHEILQALAELTPFAPLHQPHNLAGVRAARARFPKAKQIGCFDTAFHRGHPFVHDAFALPRALYDEGVRRYGFHGLSYEYIAGRLAEIAPRQHAGRVVVCHLGSGASACAMKGGKSIASTMGFSPLDGLPMGTRPGRLDPGAMLYLLQQKGMNPAQVSDLLYKQSGLKGLSGVSNDMRALLDCRKAPARQAVDYFVARVREEIAALAADLEGLDAIVFCGGIGEKSALIRQKIISGLAWLGADLHVERNRAHAHIISTDRAGVRVFVIPTNEELMIARHAKVLGFGRGNLAVAA